MNKQLTTGFVARAMRARGYTVRTSTDRPISGGSADSRKVDRGDLFAAFRGDQLDGNDFVGEAVGAGAVAVVCERSPKPLPADLTVVVAEDTRIAVKELAAAWRNACPARVVGITGTVGKTTAKEAVASVLACRFAVHRSPGNMNSREGLPLALLTLRRDHEISVLEMAMDSPGEILELCEVARPDVGIVLNIGLTHVSKLGSREAIAREKLSLVRYLDGEATAILNMDDPLIAEAAGSLTCRRFLFGAAPAVADLTYDNVVDEGLAGVAFDVSLRGGMPLPARSPLPGGHTLPAALAAISAGLVLGLDLDETLTSLETAAIEGRLRVLPGLRGSTILDDTYNSSPASLAGALRTLHAARRTGPGRRLALIGPMAELGPFEEREHRAAGRLAAALCDGLYAIGPACRAMVEEARAAGLEEAWWVATKEEAVGRLAARLDSGDVVLVKASRSLALETVIPLLTGEAAG